MKRLIITWCLLSFAGLTHAMLDLEVQGSFKDALPVAIVPFAVEKQLQVPVDIAAVVRADLQRSGVIAPLPFNQLPARPTIGSQIKFDRWKFSKAEKLVIGKVIPLQQGKYEIQFQILDIYSGKQVLGYRYSATKGTLRRVAHQISDLIYEELTGVKGAFDTLIAYVVVQIDKKTKKRIFTLAVADADGYNEQVILKSRQPIMSPAWSPSGKRLAYVSFEKGRSIVYIQELKTGRRKDVAAYKGINSAPRWAPDGKRLALTLSKDGNTEIYILYIASGVLQRITKHYGIDTEPTWAPDGRSLMFTSDRAGKPQIYKVSVNQKGRVGTPQRVTFENSFNARATYSPNGKYITLVTREDGRYRVAVLDLAQGHLQVLSQSSLDESPSFSPNSKMVLYATELRGRGVLEAVAVDGGNAPQRLRVQAGDVREPAWSPYRSR